jgi:phosphatidylglycerol---prolipoprotein diacylglyceryl transferase
MYPTLFHLGPIPIRSYGFMMMLGFVAAILLATRRARKCGADEEVVVNFGMLALVSGILGARLFYIIHYWNEFATAANPLWAMINLTAGGLEFYGGFLMAVAVVTTYMWAKKRSLRWYLDILAPSIMIGLAFGRIGCLLNGCCWGATTQCPVAIRFPYGSFAFEHQWQKTHEVKVPPELILNTPKGSSILIDREYLNMSDQQFKQAVAQTPPNTGEGFVLGLLDKHLHAFHVTLADLREMVKKLDLKTLPVYPTQIIASINAFLIAGILSFYFWRRKRDGMVLAWLFVLYPISRIIEEILRADNPHDTFGLTISQGISVASIVLALLFMVLLRFLPAQSPRAIAELKKRDKVFQT